MTQQAIKVYLFRWAGSWGPFQVKIPCGECTLTKDVILDTINKELSGIPVELELREWLSEWWKPLLKGGWHAPIVIVAGKVISQGSALNRGLLTQAVIEAYASRVKITGNHLFGKESCPHCKRAKGYLEQASITYDYHDAVSSPRALYEMLARVKPHIGPKMPITVPQIWIDGNYIGGADQLRDVVKQNVEPNYDRGQSSLSPFKDN
ncbi:MAG: glutaredoxin [Psychromonas sp.]|jgi:glutaredoxin|uniref:glutaredoxin family protein n=1 Tax=Psychromonas sp. TaxID=1884585 RepID=UPI0039E2A455